MGEYTLKYFNAKGLGEPLRFLLSYGEVDFEDVRVDKEVWPTIKEAMPFGQLPVLEIDGKRVHQSVAIGRFLARKFGLLGDTELENLVIDAIVDTISDLRAKIAAVYYEVNEEVKEKKSVDLQETLLPFYLAKLDAIAKANDGYLALGKLTWADFYFAGIVDYLSVLAGKDITADYPSLKEVVENVLEIPSIKEWVLKRPDTEF